MTGFHERCRNAGATTNRLFYVEGVGLSHDDSMTESVTDAIRVAAESMGYPDSLRRLQGTVVRAFMTRRDAFVSIPTDGGKSLCYLVLPNVFNILGGEGGGGASTQSWDAVL